MSGLPRSTNFNLYLGGLDTSVTAAEVNSSFSSANTTPSPTYVDLEITLPSSFTSQFSDQWLVGIPQGQDPNFTSGVTSYQSLIFQMDILSPLPAALYTNSSGTITTAVDFTNATVKNAPAPADNMADDWLKALANIIFSEPNAAVLFNNSNDVKTALKNSIAQNLSTILTAQLGKIYSSTGSTSGTLGATNLDDATNFGLKIFAAIAVADDNALGSLQSTNAATGGYSPLTFSGVTYNMYRLPVIGGDSIQFKVEVSADPDQMTLDWVPNSKSTETVPPITYCIKATFS